jgi:hypothetical protein
MQALAPSSMEIFFLSRKRQARHSSGAGPLSSPPATATATLCCHRLLPVTKAIIPTCLMHNQAKSPELGFIPTLPPSKGGALAPLVVSSDLAHLRVWEVGWGNVPRFVFAVFWCGSPELLHWPGLAGGFPLVCTADPLVGPL